MSATNPGPDEREGFRETALTEADVVHDMAVLFEVSLAIGTSLDLRENCGAFLKALMGGKQLDYAAVWLRASALAGGTSADASADASAGDAEEQEGGSFRRVYAMPGARNAVTVIPGDHPLVAGALAQRRLCFRAGEEPAYATEGSTLDGYVAVFALGDFGLLKLHRSRTGSPFSRSDLGQLRSVTEKFARSVEGCLAHQRLLHEVKERQRAEEEARAIAERLRTVLATVGDGITLSDDAGRFYVYNARMEEITGFSMDEANRADLLDLLHPEPSMRSRALEQLRLVEETGRVSDLEIEIVSRGGTPRTLLVSTSLLVYRGKSMYLSAFRDITARKQNEREIRELKQFYEQVLAAMPIQLAVFDLEGRYLYVNPASIPDPERRREIMGQSVTEYAQDRKLGSPVEQRRVESVRRVLETGELDEFEEAIVQKDGSVRYYARAVGPLFGEDGKLKHLIGYGSDVTEQRRAEHEVRRLKQFYEEILNSLPVDLAVFDQGGRYVFVNPNAIASAERRAWIIGKTNTEYARKRGFPEAVGAQRDTLIHRVIETGEPQDTEEHLVDREGKTRHFVRRLSPIMGERGEVYQVIGYGIDVTERTRAETALRASEARYKQFVEAASDIIYRLDMDGRFTYANPVALRATKRRADEVVGLHFDEIVAPSHLEAVRAFYRKQFDEGLPNTYYELPICDSEDNVVWIGQNVQIVSEEGEPVGVQAVARDITERIRTETALRESEALKGAILESALDAVLTIDEHSVVTEFNPAAEQIFGYTREEAIGETITDLIIPHEYREAHRAGLKRYLTTGESSILRQRIEVTARRKSGEVFPLELAITPIPLASGRPLFTAFLRDITERRQAEEALLEAKQLAEDSARAKEQFLANMSHEIRTPMNAVLGMTHLLMGTETTGEQGRYLNAIKFSADNLLALINDLLDFSKIEAGKIVFEEVPFSIADMLQGLVDSLRFNAEERGLYLRAEASEDVPKRLLGDPVRLNQILINLVGNALKFTEDGGVHLVAEVAAREEEEHGEVVAVRFSVTDTGIGIPAEKQEVIFDSFSQASSDTTRKYGGTGLGLAIVRELVDLQGGTMELKSQEGEGTTFAVTLRYPVADDALVPPDAVLGESVSIEGARILLVEDNEVNQFVAHRMLEQWGATVAIAENGRVAVERVAQADKDAFDLVLMDIQMPEMDGYEATRRIRKDLGRSPQDLPVLALTASTMLDQRRDMLAAGMNEVVMKPFEPSMLRARIGSYLPARTRARFAEEAAAAAGDGHAGQPAEPTLAAEATPADSAGPTTPMHDESHGEPAGAPPAIDLAALRENALGDEDFMAEMLALAREQIADMSAQLDDALATGDPEKAAFAAHKLKSTAGLLGALHLHAALDRLETQAREDPLPMPLADLAREARAELTRTRAALDAV
jgi:PAS domain S-box-containing protein